MWNCVVWLRCTNLSEEMTVCMFRTASYSNMLVTNPHCMPSYAEDHNLHNYLDSRSPLLLPNTTININKNRKIFENENLCDTPKTLQSTLLMLHGSNFSFPSYFKMDIPVITCLQIVSPVTYNKHRLYQGVLYFQNAWFYGKCAPIKKYCLPSIKLHNSHKRSMALSLYFSYQISPKLDNKCWKHGQKFTYAPNWSMDCTIPIFTKFKISQW